MITDPPPLLGLAAASGTGKTALLVALIPRLRAQGLRLGLIKHAHCGFDIDQPGKDSHRLRQAGAERVLIASSRRRALIIETPRPAEPTLPELQAAFAGSGLDLVLVEGFKHLPLPKIELHRQALGQTLQCLRDPDIIAVASDADPELPYGLPRLDLNAPDAIAEFILHRHPPRTT